MWKPCYEEELDCDLMEVRFSVDDKFIATLQRDMNEATASAVTRSALSLLKWVVDEAKEGRMVLSASRDGTPVHRLAMPGISEIQPAEKGDSRSGGPLAKPSEISAVTCEIPTNG